MVDSVVQCFHPLVHTKQTDKVAGSIPVVIYANNLATRHMRRFKPFLLFNTWYFAVRVLACVSSATLCVILLYRGRKDSAVENILCVYQEDYWQGSRICISREPIQ